MDEAAEGAVRGDPVVAHRREALVRMGRHLAVQAAALQIRLHREHVLLPVPVQLDWIFFTQPGRHDNQLLLLLRLLPATLDSAYPGMATLVRSPVTRTDH